MSQERASMGLSAYGLTSRPLAQSGLQSFRYPSRYGFVMIGAKDMEDALFQAHRSVGGVVSMDKLEKWNGHEYVNAVENQ